MTYDLSFKVSRFYDDEYLQVMLQIIYEIIFSR